MVGMSKGKTEGQEILNQIWDEKLLPLSPHNALSVLGEWWDQFKQTRKKICDAVAMATYCFPPTLYVMGEATTRCPILNARVACQWASTAQK
jgi:hypothetical protein